MTVNNYSLAAFRKNRPGIQAGDQHGNDQPNAGSAAHCLRRCRHNHVKHRPVLLEATKDRRRSLMGNLERAVLGFIIGVQRMVSRN